MEEKDNKTLPPPLEVDSSSQNLFSRESQEINKDSRSQLLHLTAVCNSMQNPNYAISLRSHMGLIHSTKTGFGMDEVEDLITLGERSLVCDDRDLAESQSCDKSVISNLRHKMIAAYLRSLPQEFTQVIVPFGTQKRFLNLIDKKKQKLFLPESKSIAFDREIHPLIRSYFMSYSIHFTTRVSFSDLDIELDEPYIFEHDRAVRYYLDPNAKKSKGFRFRLRDFLFSALANNPNYLSGLQEELESLPSRFQDYRHEHYEITHRMKNITEGFCPDALCQNIQFLAEQLMAGNNPSHFGTDYQELSRVIYNYFLLRNNERSVINAFNSHSFDLTEELKEDNR